MGAPASPLRLCHRAASLRFPTVLICLLCLIVLPAAHAFKLVPMTMEFEPSGRGTSRAFTLDNDSPSPVAIQISILSRSMTRDGKEENAPAENDFIIFPEQVLLKAGQSQTVRVKWKGSARPEKELAYRILAEELPINLNKEKPKNGQVSLLVRYMGSIYIAPKGAKADLILDSVTRVSGENGRPALEAVFSNRGTAHIIMRDLRLTLKAGGKMIELAPEALNGISGENILAGVSRYFRMPWPAELPDGAVEASFVFHPK